MVHWYLIRTIGAGAPGSRAVDPELPELFLRYSKPEYDVGDACGLHSPTFPLLCPRFV